MLLYALMYHQAALCVTLVQFLQTYNGSQSKQGAWNLCTYALPESVVIFSMRMLVKAKK